VITVDRLAERARQLAAGEQLVWDEYAEPATGPGVCDRCGRAYLTGQRVVGDGCGGVRCRCGVPDTTPAAATRTAGAAQ
jgi:hypothetical protein